MNIRNRKKGFTLVEIMIVVVIIGLLAAMAIPAFQKVRQNSKRSALLNDARQIAAAAQQFFLEKNVTTVAIGYNSTKGQLGTDLAEYVKQVGTGYTVSSNLTADGSFQMSHPLVKGGFSGSGNLGTAVDFNAEGQLYTQ